jgi:hypothetical protein
MGKIIFLDAVAFVLWLALALALLAVSGCEYSKQARTQTREKIVLVGTAGGVPVEATVERATETNHQEEGQTDDSLFKALGQGISTAFQGGSSLATGGAAGLAVGLLGMGVAWFQKRKAERQRDEIIDGVERAKPKLASYGGAWDTLTEALEAEQSRDTVKTVKGRVG